MSLKKKKMYEGQLEQVENNILRVQEQQMGLENARVTAETVQALHHGAQASKATMQARRPRGSGAAAAVRRCASCWARWLRSCWQAAAGL